MLSRLMCSWKMLSLVMVLICCGCNRTNIINCQSYRHGSGEPNYPEYLYYVWPGPNGTFAQICYEKSLEDQYPEFRGVGVYILGAHVDAHYSDGSVPMVSRVFLYIDDTLLPDDTISISVAEEILDENDSSYDPPIPSLFMMSWTPELTQGEHEARLEIIRDTGETLEYTWVFTITK